MHLLEVLQQRPVGRDAAQCEPFAQRRREVGYRAGLAMECAVADDRALSIIEIENGGETEVDALRGELRADDAAPSLGIGDGEVGVAIPCLAQRAHGGHTAETVAEPLDPTAFVVDTDQRRRIARRADTIGQRLELSRRFVVAREKDHAADQRMGDAPPIFGVEIQPGDIEHHRSARRRHPFWTAASRINAFICRTASRKPTKTARLTIAWPMCSSRTPGSAATGWTLT